ncbi:hypothetical protein ACES2L_05065 [Bdellovibrio bacteriovorus]
MAFRLFLILISLSPSVFADVSWDPANYWWSKDRQQSECMDIHGVYVNGVCIEASASGQVAAILHNDFRKSGGNETSVGDHVTEGSVKVTRTNDHSRIKNIFISVSMIPKDQVLNYNEKAEQNYHNKDRIRADGYVDRPWMIANIGANIEITDSQDVTVLAGSFPASGLDPLQGKPSRYYMTAPYGIFVRYDKGIQMNYQLKEELDRVILASFSVVDGDTLKGESSIDPFDSRANSYPAYAGTLELRVLNAVRKIFNSSHPHFKNHDLYVGVTGAHGDVGSYPGEKRTQDDMTAYLGYVFTSKWGDAEVRVFKSDFTRNKMGDGNGRHGPQINSDAKGVEVALRNIETKHCSWDFYYNQHVFDSDGQDGELSPEKVRAVKGWTVGSACRNAFGVKDLAIGVEYGRNQLTRNKGAKDVESYPTTASQFNLTFSYRFNLNKLIR